MLPFIIGGVVAVIAGIFGYSIFSSEKKEIYVSVLGPSSSGKTTLHNYLRKTEYKDATIGHNDLEKIVIKKGNQKVTIKKGKDIAGTDQAVKAYYKEEIQLSDVSFFIFDSSKILEKETYSKNVNGRLNFINKYCKTSKKEKLKIMLIASHFDKVKTKPSAKKLIWEKIDKIANEGKINKPIYIDLTNETELEALKNELFK
ncbi:GTPase domain-containing protein [Oceanihabitans sp. 2_MG-2023]|jgi:GTPase SAR1 family protein|uniref:GTPase domain-containing protein n=1 Tax=Oceanihabitans sp. 2_MG-2023 TaxID=3062661 RepID=UPI0026E2282A|nr:GTPase domain-containing protein [Oceanihabitans sp. 2_MG-2023]MDO6598466.1 GTPase domain-containing protein [Oceanihabitans sp. 2_MG-2023]